MERKASTTSRPDARGTRREFGNEIDLRATLLTLWRGKWVIAIMMLFAGSMGFLSVSRQAPVYSATAKVMFDSPRPQFDGLQTVVSTPKARASLTNQIEILRSTSLITRVITELKLDQHPQFTQPQAQGWVWPEWALERAMDLGLMPPPRRAVSEDVRLVRREDALIEAVLRGLTLEPIKSSDVIVIRYTSPNRQLASDIANTVAEQYIVDQLEGKLATFRAATQWLTDRVHQLQDRVERAENAVLTAEALAKAKAGASLEATKSQIVVLNRDLAAARRLSTELRAQRARLSGALKVGTDLAALSEFRTVTAVTRLQARRADLVSKDRNLAGTLRSTHPRRLGIAEELTQIQGDIQREADREMERLRLDIEAAAAKERQLVGELKEAEAKAFTLSGQSIEIRNLEREAQASRILYENLLARLQETNAQEDLQGADARILTAAKPPQHAVSTGRNRVLAGSLIAGGLFGGLLVLGLNALNVAFRSISQVEETLDVPVLATIPSLGRNMSRRAVVDYIRDKPSSSLAEAIRNLRTSILFSDLDNPPKVVLFSSSVPSEGKTTTAVLTALTSQQMGRSAIIVDCDLRKPALSDLVQPDRERSGLLTVLEGEATIEEAVHQEKETGLHVLMTQEAERSARINAADVLATQKFKTLIKDLSERYDLVVLDTPPTLVVTDARIVASLADAVVFAVRWDKTPRGAVAEGLRELTGLGAPVIGVAMTMINERRAARFAHGGQGFYKGMYRDYYEA